MKSTKMLIIKSVLLKKNWRRISKLHCHCAMSIWKIPKRYITVNKWIKMNIVLGVQHETPQPYFCHNNPWFVLIFFLFCRYFKATLRASLGRLDQCYHRGRPIAYGSRALLNWCHSGVLDKHTALVRLVIHFHEIDKKNW